MLLSAMKSPMERNALLAYLALATPGNHILVFHARNGVGKTSVIRQIAIALGVEPERVKRWSLGQVDPLHFGWPVPGDAGMRFVMPAAIATLNDGRPALWNLDELGDAPRTVQAAAHRLLDSRELGDDVAGPALKIIGSINPPEYATDAQEMGFGFANRCSFVPFETPSKADFVAYRNRRGAPQAFAFAEIKDRDEAVGYINGVATAYFGTEPGTGNPNAVLEEDPKDEAVAGRWPMAFATPRSWDYALELAATCIAAGDRGAMVKLMEGTIGHPQAVAFAAFEADQDLLPGLKAAQEPTLFTPDPKRPDRTFAQLMVVAAAVTNPALKGKDAQTWYDRGWDFVEHCKQAGGKPWAITRKGVALVAASTLAEHMMRARLHLPQRHEALVADLSPLVAATMGVTK